MDEAWQILYHMRDTNNPMGKPPGTRARATVRQLAKEALSKSLDPDPLLEFSSTCRADLDNVLGKFLAARHVRRMIEQGTDSATVDYISLSSDELWLDMFASHFRAPLPILKGVNGGSQAGQ